MPPRIAGSTPAVFVTEDRDDGTFVRVLDAFGTLDELYVFKLFLSPKTTSAEGTLAGRRRSSTCSEPTGLVFENPRDGDAGI